MFEERQVTNPQQAVPSAPNTPADNADADDPLTSTYPKKRSYKRRIILVLFVILVLGGVFLWRYLSGFESTDDAQVDVHLYPVSARISGYV
jgi:membrane fusion protein (multidrug efflux system)